VEQIRQLRKERGLSQARLAVMADMDPATLNRLEQGKGNPNLKTLERVASALGVEVGDLLGKADAPPSWEPTFYDVLAEERRTPTAAEMEEVTAELERLIAQRRAAIERWEEAGIDTLEEATCGSFEMDRANEQIYRDLRALGADEVIRRRHAASAEDVDAAYRQTNAFSRLIGIAAQARNVSGELSKQASQEAAGGLARLEELRLIEREA
jgi:transcriptional regulator with XRE-family HTH domain